MGFILTLWDLKKKLEKLRETVEAFYLNVVGFKGRAVSLFRDYQFRFILTLWDLKFIASLVTEFTELVLS